jgi:hypothetical protein
MKIELKNLY